MADDCDSEIYIEQVDRMVTGEPSIKDFDEAILFLNFALKKNSSVKASGFALKTIEFLEKHKKYKEKNYRFMPSSISGKIINKKDSDIEYNESYVYSVATHGLGTRHEENKIFGMKPLRYLSLLAGTIYSDKWAAGYTEKRAVNEGEVTVSVEDGGTVAVKAGTFENCIKVTLDLEIADKAGRDYYFENFMYTHCGKKIYWFAPNVGIVKHDCIWGGTLSSVCELSEFRSAATDGEYMPVYIGNRWVYDEMTIEKEYTARCICDVLSGIENEFFITCEQEFLFSGTEKEYTEFKNNLK